MSGDGPKDGESKVIRGFVDRLEGGFAVVVTEEGEEVLWPAKELPEGARPGVAVILAMAVDYCETARREAEVRDLLRDIFGPSHEDT